jgi:hypothetical protein
MVLVDLSDFSVTVRSSLLLRWHHISIINSDWLRAERSGVRIFESRQGLGIFLFSTASRPALGPNQPPFQWVPGALSPMIKRPGRKANHTPPSSAEVKNAWRYTSIRQYIFIAWYLVKHRDNFTAVFWLHRNKRFPWSGGVLQKSIVFQTVKNSHPFKENGGLCPCSIEKATGLYPAPAESSPHPLSLV